MRLREGMRPCASAMRAASSPQAAGSSASLLMPFLREAIAQAMDLAEAGPPGS